MTRAITELIMPPVVLLLAVKTQRDCVNTVDSLMRWGTVTITIQAILTGIFSLCMSVCVCACVCVCAETTLNVIYLRNKIKLPESPQWLTDGLQLNSIILLPWALWIMKTLSDFMFHLAYQSLFSVNIILLSKISHTLYLFVTFASVKAYLFTCTKRTHAGDIRTYAMQCGHCVLRGWSCCNLHNSLLKNWHGAQITSAKTHNA